MAFDTTRLLAQVKLRGALPTGRFSDQEILDLAYDYLLASIVPAVLLDREEYFVTSDDIAIVASQAAYAIPTRALNGIVRDVKLVLSSGEVQKLPRIDVEEIETEQTGDPQGFYVLGNNLVLYPTPSTAQSTLRIWFPLRPSRLVPTTEAGAITAINTGTHTVSLTIPSGWSASNTFDLLKGRAHYDVLSRDGAAGSVGAGTIMLSTTLPTGLAVGDYIALAEESPFPLLPPEGHVALACGTAAAALGAMGDPGTKAAAETAAEALAAFKAVLAVRVQGQPKALSRRIL